MQPAGSHINFSEHPHNLFSVSPKVGFRSYRFGYQGSEKDDEVYGVTGSMYTTFFREYDARIARWITPDPETKKAPWESPYVSMGDNPIWHNDTRGNSAGVPDETKQKIVNKSSESVQSAAKSKAATDFNTLVNEWESGYSYGTETNENVYPTEKPINFEIPYKTPSFFDYTKEIFTGSDNQNFSFEVKGEINYKVSFTSQKENNAQNVSFFGYSHGSNVYNNDKPAFNITIQTGKGGIITKLSFENSQNFGKYVKKNWTKPYVQTYLKLAKDYHIKNNTGGKFYEMAKKSFSTGYNGL